MSAIYTVLASLLVALNTLAGALLMLPFALIKFLLPIKAVRALCDHALNSIATGWVSVNGAWINAINRTRWRVSGLEGLNTKSWYLVISNHQSWVDILVLQKVFNRRIPLLRFFLKRQLFWVPLLGMAWWALDFPFMGRYTPRQVAKNPALAGRDIEATRRACDKFRAIPVAIMNFVEGTRFTDDKHAKQGSPYRHLLKPKSGGVAFVLDAMGEGLHAILDVSIAYPAGRPSLVDLLADRVPEVRVQVRQRPIPTELVGGDYQGDREFRVRFQQWMNGLWREKDEDLAALLGATSAAPGDGRN